VGGVAEALGLLGRTVHELENRVAVLEAEPEISVEPALPFELAPRASQVAGVAVLAPPAASLARVPEEDKLEVPWSGTHRRRRVAVAFTLLVLVGSCGLIASMVFSYLYQ
jgi:hypothetical protein